MSRVVVGIDPGLTGAFCVTDGRDVEFFNMPVKGDAKAREVDFAAVSNLLADIASSYGDGVHVFLERALPMAMGSKHAFNYGRGFAAIEIALTLEAFPVTYVEPQKWAKELHAGISRDLKPKAKSLIAAERLYPKLFKFIERSPKAKAPHEGQVDALLIAGYGLRVLK